MKTGENYSQDNMRKNNNPNFKAVVAKIQIPREVVILRQIAKKAGIDFTFAVDGAQPLAIFDLAKKAKQALTPKNWLRRLFTKVSPE